MPIELQQIGQYELRQRLQRKNTGEVWRAYDKEGQRTVLLKLSPAHLIDTPSLNQYMQDVERVASLHHPNIVRIQAIQVLTPRGTDDSSPLICLVTDYIEGLTLVDYIRNTAASGKIPAPTDIVQIFSALALAIDNAHQHGIVHGNLKPTNILFNQSTLAPGQMGIPMLTDFGPTKLLPKKQGNDIPFYLAPEQVNGAAANASSDIYALGVLLYELYTGAPPFRGNRPVAVMMQQVNALPTSPDLINPGISSALAQLIMRSLAKNSQSRPPTAVALAVALANALHVPISESLRRADALTNRSAHSTESKNAPLNSAIPVEQTKPQTRIQPDTKSTRAFPLFASGTGRAPRKTFTGVIVALALIVLLGASLGTWLLLKGRGNAPQTQLAGHAFFMNSGQISAKTTQGINDELEVDLSNLPQPSSGKQYYLWLLGDLNQPETTPLFLGPLKLEQGNVHILYPGNQQHTNLLSFISRLLINEDSIQNPASNPLLSQSTWRYYAVLPQTPSSTDALHFSMLDHLRHLLVESPELSLRGLHGGLAFWFAKDTALVANIAGGLAANWQNADGDTLHSQLVSILDYLDGSAFVKSDVPAGTPLVADAQIAQVPLFGPAPQSADPPGYVFQNEAPPGYVYLLQSHLSGATLTPQATTEQHQLATQVSQAVDVVKRQFTQLYRDAKQLVSLTSAQLLQPSVLTTLNDMATQAQYAYTGQPNHSTGNSQGGSLWIYNNLQQLAAFVIEPYTAPQA